MAYAYEQGVNPRKPPPTTPALVQGRPPRPALVEAVIRGSEQEGVAGAVMAEATFRLDVAAGTMGYELEVMGIPREELYAVTLNRVVAGGATEGAGASVAPEEVGEAEGAPERRESVIHRLLAPGETTASGTIELGNRGREDLLQGRLFLVLYAAPAPLGTYRTPVQLPTSNNSRG
jgi:hypothetical protein